MYNELNGIMQNQKMTMMIPDRQSYGEKSEDINHRTQLQKALPGVIKLIDTSSIRVKHPYWDGKRLDEQHLCHREGRGKENSLHSPVVRIYFSVQRILLLRPL
jgi:hypothetical protein